MTRRTKRTITVITSLLILFIAIMNATPQVYETVQGQPEVATGDAAQALETLAVKGRAPKTGYTRSEFGNGWGDFNGCDMRNVILFRDLTSVTTDQTCKVMTGVLNDYYTNTVIQFSREKGEAVQIDHIVALSDAWQKGAQQLSKQQRTALANDPIELLAVDGPTNQEKGDSDAATWLPPNKQFRCEYVARQIAVKKKYTLWVTEAEKVAMNKELASCPGQALPAQ